MIMVKLKPYKYPPYLKQLAKHKLEDSEHLSPSVRQQLPRVRQASLDSFRTKKLCWKQLSLSECALVSDICMFSGECWTLRFAWRSTLIAFTSFYTWKRFRWRWTLRSMISMARPWLSTKQTKICLFSMWVRSKMIFKCVLVYFRCCHRYHDDVKYNFRFLNVIFHIYDYFYLCL